MKKVFLIDDHLTFRNGFRMMLEVIQGIEVCGESSSDINIRASLSLQRPDLLFIDVHLRHVNCFLMISELRHEFPDMKIILLSMFAEQSYKVDAEIAGASAVLYKPNIGNSLEEVLHELYHHEFPEPDRSSGGFIQNR